MKVKVNRFTNELYTRYAWAFLRIGLGWIFLWAFLDKLFGLGFGTCRDKTSGAINYICSSEWIEGGSPTYGFLTNAAKGPFVEYFQAMAGSAIVDWLFMLGLLGIGLSLLLGIAVRIAATTGMLMMLLMYLAAFMPPANNPILDDHLIYFIALFGIRFADAGITLGFGRQWARMPFICRNPILH